METPELVEFRKYQEYLSTLPRAERRRIQREDWKRIKKQIKVESHKHYAHP
jgi:hypothetical protein